jgi:DNA-binding response OmpR family regulator
MVVSKVEHWCSHNRRVELRILLVEDNVLFGDALSEHLALRGWTVTWVTGFHAAAEILQQSSFDLICLDRRLPDGDGFDILRRGLATCPTLVLSAFDQLSDRLEGERLGASDYLVKPFNLDSVVHRLVALLPRPVQARRA